LEHVVVHADRRGTLEGLITLVAEGTGFLLVYLALMLVISPIPVEQLKATVLGRLGKAPEAAPRARD
jgi:hypothetical protein